MSDSDFSIRFQNVSKSYRLGQISHGYFFRDLQSYWAKFRQKEDPNSSVIGKTVIAKTFLALRNISFDVKPGEVIGVIGRNGAGKSTLLKILSRITTPTNGQIQYKGRIGSLLEVGTGFHPELSGRENIFLNGAILGMSRKEIYSKFDEIVDFAGISDFIDTPVKRYSSGMYVRLAFAVAAHLEPEILIVDEVLAVGDIEFQKKCLGKMESVSKQSGRTILFVSHNMPAIANLCKRVIVLNQGEIIHDGDTQEGIQKYLHHNTKIILSDLGSRADRVGEGRIQFMETWTENPDGERKQIFSSGESVIIAIRFRKEANLKYKGLSVAFALKDYQDYQITDLNSVSINAKFSEIDSEFQVVRCKIPRIPLTSGTYNYNAIIRTDTIIQDFILNIGGFQIEEGDFFLTGKTIEKGQGAILMDQEWFICAE